ncbi:protein CcmA, bactofilin family [Alkalispirochaeta americana]|uniref:Protein CcmA, bactofilin family n=1 Tax=Alkalispirochaeta americana TaxID=159291 RepID=A0A1N6W2Q3_9SPIO|nr:polymer-forming cytoskeletal protein [Alkalispirochaeta americana]SIQ84308.1 protein CcmA, bactofilin family [Alkalispirochaeta americana]
MAVTESTLVNSIVGAGTFFKGQIDVSGLLRIDGDFSGGVKTSGRVIVGRGGRADCTIDAATVVIGGVFRGTIYASEKVILLETAMVLGNIFAPRLIADSGVILDGAVHLRGVEQKDPRQTVPAGEKTVSEAGSHRRKRRSGRRRLPVGNL